MKRSNPFKAAAWVAVTLATSIVGLAGPAQAQSDAAQLPTLDTSEAASQPVAVVSLSGVAALGDAAIFLSDAAGQPAAGGMFATMARGFTTGIDPQRPMGLVVNMKDGAPAPLLFVPSDDISKFLQRMEGQLGPAEKLEDDPDTLVIAAGASLLYIKQSGKWAFAAQNRELLKDLPADPLKLLGGLDKTYDVAVRVNVQQVPVDQRNMLIGALKQGFQQGMARQAAGSGADAEAAAEAQRVAEASLQQLEDEIENTETLMFGLSVDTERARTFIDLVSTAVEGSETAEIYTNTFALPSKFASVISPDAAAYYHASTSVSPKAVERMRSSIDQSMQTLRRQIEKNDDINDIQKQELLQFIRQFVDLSMNTIEEGKLDVGFQLDLSGTHAKLFGGAFVSDGAKVVDLVKELAAKLQNDPQAPKFSFDESTYKGVNIHSVVAKIADDKAAEILGEELTIKLGTANDAFYFASGDDAEGTLKQLIDSGAQDTEGVKRPLGQFYMSLTPFVRLIDRVDSNDIVAAVLQAAQNSEQTDRVRLTTHTIDRGQAIRIVVGEGIFRAAGAGAAAAQPQPAGAAF
ncbi:hypothetical protein [Roseimaritima ulvae]|uniref:Uncharacterized protein n=1 Tax=Roseimaritima ulvae TaxID=980254 RepID=A0A5B9QSK5_9BACT|nr:hypothetical protein [Roseimaritima ulvae]QEG40710.1 hypothetical protein UC8_27270 [Roseimaritima ulvae]